MNKHYHFGQTIKEYRQKGGMSQATLAEYWPGHPVNIRYVQFVETGKRNIVDQDTLRQLSQLLNIPLWQFGLSEYNPFSPQVLPGNGEHLFQETLDTAEHLIQKTWYLRRIAPISEAEESAQYLSSLFRNFLTSQPPSSVLEPRFLRLYAQVQRLIGVMHVERKQYAEAIAAYSNMYNIAKQLDEPYFLTLALMNMGVELERIGQKHEAIEHLEKARDTSFGTSKEVAALVHSYLARAYASHGDGLRFQRAIENAQTLMSRLKQKPDNDTNHVFFSTSGVLAELSYGYPEIGEPRKTLEMKDEIIHQIKLDRNTRLHAWIPLDWARAYFMLSEIEESAKAGREFFHRSLEIQSPQAIGRAREHLIKLEQAGYENIEEVQQFRDELEQAKKEREK
jgi:tetratricopeptide (TPR) repeat protein